MFLVEAIVHSMFESLKCKRRKKMKVYKNSKIKVIYFVHASLILFQLVGFQINASYSKLSEDFDPTGRDFDPNTIFKKYLVKPQNPRKFPEPMGAIEKLKKEQKYKKKLKSAKSLKKVGDFCGTVENGMKKIGPSFHGINGLIPGPQQTIIGGAFNVIQYGTKGASKLFPYMANKTESKFGKKLSVKSYIKESVPEVQKDEFVIKSLKQQGKELEEQLTYLIQKNKTSKKKNKHQKLIEEKSMKLLATKTFLNQIKKK